MSQKANYFKLGLFVIGAVAAGIIVLLIIGSGRWFQKRIMIETYFNESVQGLDVGSKLKVRGVAVGEVTRIGFTYNRYQLDRPMADRARYVMVEAQIEPRLLGGRAGAGDLTNAESAGLEVERGLRVRLAPQGITGTSYLEIDYFDPPPPLLQIDWTPDNIYIPSTRSTVTALVNAACEIMDRLHNLDIEGTLANLNKLMVTANTRLESVDAKAISDRRDARPGQDGDAARRAQYEEALGRGERAACRVARVERRPEEAARQSRRRRRFPTRRSRRCSACARSSTIRTSRGRSRTCRARSDASTVCWAVARPTSRRRSRICDRSPTTCAT